MQVRQMPDDGRNIGHNGSTLPEAHNGKQRRVLEEGNHVGGATGYGRGDGLSSSDDWHNGSPAQARRPLRTVPLIPLEGTGGISPRKESAPAVWNYIGDTDEIKPVASAAPASASNLDEVIDEENLIQTQPSLPRIQGTTGEYMQRRRLQRYPDTDEQEMRQIPVRRRRLVRTSSLAPEAEPVAIALPLPSTAPLSSPYDRLLPSWQLRRKRDTIFLVLLTLLVLSILGILACNYLLSMYH
jgi:hypothetical protein